MLRRIGFWALAGCAVSLALAAVFYILGPANGSYRSQEAVLHYLSHPALLPVTAPVALLGRHHAMTWYWATVINAGMYAVLGLAVETIRLALPSRFARPRQ